MNTFARRRGSRAPLIDNDAAIITDGTPNPGMISGIDKGSPAGERSTHGTVGDLFSGIFGASPEAIRRRTENDVRRIRGGGY